MNTKSPEIVKLVKEQELSGQSIAEFCRQRGLERKQFYGLRQRVIAGEKQFVRVSGSRKVELELSGGAVIRVEPEDLKLVLEALR